jgi:membrane protein implicated in regulation of membrane protease activity
MIFRKRYTTSTRVKGFREVWGGVSVVAFFLGMATIVVSILLGRSYAFYVSFLAFSLIMTLLWRKAYRP